ncbi:MAG: hypothetical protein IJW61_01385 [Clostridia bacterium]|nr:hypothetical protein [Clostridia bacterium]
MKKITAIFALLAMILSLTACGKDEQIDFDIAKTKDIVLGNEVGSVTIKTAGGGELALDGSADFYEIFDSINFEFENGIKCSGIAEIKLGDESRSYINMNSYHLDGEELYEFRAKKEGDGAISVIEEYTSYKQSAGGSQMVSFGNYSYKEEKALGGYENGVKYSSSEYPLIPEPGTELCDMQVRAVYLRTLINSTELFARYEAFEINGETYDLGDFVEREYKLYENYIVFKQTAPFLSVNFTGADQQLMYMQIMNSDFSVTQEAYYNVETGKIEFIRIYGETIWHTAEYVGRKAEIDIKMYVYELDGSEGEQKIQGLINRIKSSVE